MTAQEFINKWNGKGIDYDGYYGFQCMDVYLQYQKEVLGVQPKGASYAKLVWDSYDRNVWDRIPNTPSGVPQLGDVMIWGMNPYGHIAVVLDGNVNTFRSLDQNWDGNPNNPAKIITHNYTNVLGWLRPKGLTMAQYDELMAHINALRHDVDIALGQSGKLRTDVDYLANTRINKEIIPDYTSKIENHTHPAPEEKPEFDEPTRGFLQSLSDFLRKLLNK